MTNSRLSQNRGQVWRRRACKNCKAVFTTYEIIDLTNSVALERSARTLEAFSEDKLFLSIYESCKHRKKPVEDSRALTNTVTSLLMKNHLSTAKLTPATLAGIVFSVLSRFDPTAATIYAAYHPLASDQAAGNV